MKGKRKAERTERMNEGKENRKSCKYRKDKERKKGKADKGRSD